MTDLYEKLGLTSDASDEQIRKSYLQLARRYHPDHNHSEEATELFKEITEAYQILHNPKTRAEYNQTINLEVFGKEEMFGEKEVLEDKEVFGEKGSVWGL